MAKVKGKNKVAAFAAIGIVSLAIIAIAVMTLIRQFRTVPTGGTVDPGTSSSMQSSEPEEPKVPEPTTLKMVAVGDNLIHSSIYNQAKARANGNGYDFDYAYENITSLINGDLNYINQETIIAGDVLEPSDYPCFNSPVELGEKVYSMGFNMVNHANNHVLDRGLKGFNATIDFWKNKPDVCLTGAYKNQEDLDQVKIMEKKGIKFSFIGITEHTNGIPMPKNSDIKLIYSSEEDLIKAQIEAAKAASDFVIVSIHWGTENSHVVNNAQRALAQKMVDWGADLIIGTHPHVLQSIEYITRESDGKKVLCAYSLGNFISAQSQSANLIGGILTFDITKEYENGTISVSNVLLTPTITHYTAGYKNIKLYTLDQYNETLAKAHGSKDGYMSMDFINKTVSSNIDASFLK